VFVTLDSVGSTISKVDPARPQDVSVLVDRPMDAPDGALSPDDRFLVYQVLETTVWQIRILDLKSGRHTTVADGFSPMWSPEGNAVFYQSAAEDSTLMMMPFSPATGGAGRSVVFSDVPVVLNGNDIASNGRALVLVPTQPAVRASVIVNWPALVRGVR
jgi:Tol biopolymer transport system component